MDFYQRLAQPRIFYRDQALSIESAEETNPIYVRYPELLQTRPVRFDTFDDGSFPVDVQFSISPANGEFRYKMFWLAPFSAKVHLWYVDEHGRRREAGWLSEEEALSYFESQPLTSAKVSRRLSLAAEVNSDLISMAVACLWHARRDPRFCDAELAATVLNSAELNSIPIAQPLLKLSANIAEAFCLEEAKNFEKYLSGKCFTSRVRPIILALSAHPTRIREDAREGLVQLDVMARADASVDFGTPLPPPKIGTFAYASDNTFNFDFKFCKPGTLQIKERVNYLSKPRVMSPIRLINEIASRCFVDYDLQSLAKQKYGIDAGDSVAYAIQFGDAPMDRPSLAYGCKNEFEKITMIPDPYFTESMGFQVMRRMTNQNWVDWTEREDSIFWRGQSTGTIPLTMQSLLELPRYKLCSQSLTMAGVDCKFVSIVQAPDDKIKSDLTAHCNNLGLIDKWVPEIEIIKQKFVVDIDGNVNSWGFFTKLLMGNCVLKVSSMEGWSQWYYKDLRPWEHFVPVRSDLSDFEEIIDWCRANLDACAAISRTARDFALRRSYSSEMKLAGEALLHAACNVPLR